MLTRTQEYKPSHGKWICGRCHVPLEQLPVQAAYLQGAFDVSKMWHDSGAWGTGRRQDGRG